MDTSVPPRSTRRASNACRSAGMGVVRCAGAHRSAIFVSTVPTSPVLRSSAVSKPSRRYVVVVFPLVPVTAKLRKRSAGSP